MQDKKKSVQLEFLHYIAISQIQTDCCERLIEKGIIKQNLKNASKTYIDQLDKFQKGFFNNDPEICKENDKMIDFLIKGFEKVLNDIEL